MLQEFLALTILVLLGAVFSLTSGLSPQPWAKSELAPGEIRFSDARVLDAIWVDARSRSDDETSHIPKAILLDEKDQGWIHLMEVWLADPRPIIIYYSDADCSKSKQVARNLRQDLPDAEIYTLKGGEAAWKK